MTGRADFSNPLGKFLPGIAAVAALLACFAVIRGCEHAEPGSAGPPESPPRRGGSFRTIFYLPDNLDPAFSDDVYTKAVVNQLFDGLIRLDPNLRPMPAIASYWEISPDRLRYVFHLRRRVCFHNGREVTSADFVYSFRRVLATSPDAPSPGRNALHVIQGALAFSEGRADDISGIRAPDPYTLELHLERPYHGFLSMLASDNMKVVPREEVERPSTTPFGKRPIGTGPFRLGSWNDLELVLTRFDDYFGSPPYLDAIHYVSIFVLTSEDDLYTRFETRKLDLIPAWGRRVDEYESKGDYPIIRRRDPSLYFVGFNVQSEPLNDPRVRRAFAHAVDRDRLIENESVFLTKACGIIPPGFFGYSPKDHVLEFDREKTKRLLADAGYPGGEGLPVFTYYTAGEGPWDERMIADLKEVGIRMKVKQVHLSLLQRGLRDSWIHVFGTGYAGDVTEGDDFLFSLFHSMGAVNYFHYRNPELDRLVDRSLSLMDSRLRYQLCQEAEALVLRDHALVPLFHSGDVYVLQPYVRGLAMGPRGLTDIALEKVWFERDPENQM
jgi:oligopeptide transport system substrate-binding protein